MDNPLLIATAAAGALNLILLIILAVVIIKNLRTAEKMQHLEDGLSRLSQGMGSEFERSRREQSAAQEQMRRETGEAIEGVNKKMEALRVDNSERQNRLERAMSKALIQMLRENSEQNEKQTKQISESIKEMSAGNEKKLEEMRVTVDEKLSETLSKRLDTSFKTVSDRLESVYKSLGEVKELSNGVTGSVNSLNRVLTNVKARGTWAEIQLGSILDQTLPGMYEKNFAPRENSSDRVEFAVRIPSNDGTAAYLPIDSKFPLEDYVRLSEAAQTGDAAALASARKALETRILNEAKEVSKYINVPVTTPFAILYLATEGLYAEAYSASSSVPERVMRDYNVMLAGPSTITALLNSLALGFRAVAINEKATEITAVLAAAKQQYDKFGDLLSKARKKIDEAGTVLDEADRRNGIIKKKLGSVDGLEGGNAEYVLGITETNKEDDNQ